MRITTRKLRQIIRRSITESMNPPEDQMTPEEEEEYYEHLIAQHEEMEDGRYEREDAMYRKQIGEARRRRRRMLRESLHGHMDGNIMNLVLHAAQLVGAEYGDITVSDVLKKLQKMPEQEVIDHADPMGYDSLEYNEYFVSTIRQIDYDTVVEKMWELVEHGELADGYEDFFSLPGA